MGYQLQYSCLEDPHGQRSLKVYSPWGLKESDMTEWLNTAQSHINKIKQIIKQKKNFFTTAQDVASETTHSLSCISSSKMWISHRESATHKLHWDSRLAFSSLIWWLWEIGSDCLEHCCKEFSLSGRKHQELWVRSLVSTRWGSIYNILATLDDALLPKPIQS